MTLPKKLAKNTDYKVTSKNGVVFYVRLMKWFWQSKYSYMVGGSKATVFGYFEAIEQFKTKKELLNFLNRN